METAANYDAWYQTPRGHWIGDREFRLLWNMIQPKTGEALLDVGCGSGYFSQRFSDHGIGVIGVDIDDEMVAYARKKHSNLRCLAGSALALPFHDKAFDHVAAVASLCFIDCPQCALAEMWRVSRKTVTLGLLNRHSLLFREKSGRGGYAGARWDTVGEIRRKWLLGLFPEPAGINIRFAIFFHQGGSLARWMERLLPSRLPWGSFLAVTLRK
ncbi:MAG TPA: class I SAM-dependent methyltransferase [Thiolapillus brandeum]|uniref:Class I SAM-dependent methyltransferase n=1 Tax=Thiolapillus brandeum TaxID=1076588 RepID=A0A831NVQ2_9GAMM|nr:class I SAM-dependent methyltransferase [Thiolapillus brandeum]